MNRCSGFKRATRGCLPNPCCSVGSVERDGKWYCKQHDPVEIKNRDIARRAKWVKEDRINKMQGEKNTIYRRRLAMWDDVLRAFDATLNYAFTYKKHDDPCIPAWIYDVVAGANSIVLDESMPENEISLRYGDTEVGRIVNLGDSEEKKKKLEYD